MNKNELIALAQVEEAIAARLTATMARNRHRMRGRDWEIADMVAGAALVRAMALRIIAGERE